MAGTWTLAGSEITLQNQSGPKDCGGAARYTISRDGEQFGLDVVADECPPRQMILDRSRWLPPGAARRSSGAAHRAHRRIREDAAAARRAGSSGDWPSFRGREASGISDAPEPSRHAGIPRPARTSCGARRFPASRTRARSSGATRSSSRARSAASANATFKPGLYGDGDASDDRSRASLDALRDRQAHRQDPLGANRGARRAAQQAPHQVDLRQRLARHRRPHRRRVVRIAGHLCLRLRRRTCAGRSISAASTWAPTTSPPTNGARPARRSSGTAW